jgi:peptide deformylase
MSVLSVRLFTDKVLHKPTELITNFNSEELFKLSQDMIETMFALKGIGLAAPQVGLAKQLFVANIEDKSRIIMVANPKVLCYNKEVGTEEYEGCLSAPNISVKIKRPTWVEFEYQKLNGEKDKMRLENFDARVFFHEADHIFGRMITDSIYKL